ncbi:MAG: hypothetical protein GEU79_13965 [Acidimicrobiia bacterium]|nr:hypothetical protein [Acidimicrobiia bacterium]
MRNGSSTPPPLPGLGSPLRSSTWTVMSSSMLSRDAFGMCWDAGSENAAATGAEGIRLATLDPSAGYRRALEDHLPRATLVVDHLHAIRLANRAIDEVRRRVQNETLVHRGRKPDPLYRARRVLLTGYERLTEEPFQGWRLFGGR